MSALKQFALGDLDQELAATRRLLERVPDEHLGWRPHEKSWTLGALAAHIVNLLFWQRHTLEDDGFDLGALPPPREAPPSAEALLRTFDEHLALLERAVAETDEDALQATWTLRHGDHVLSSQPRAAVLRGMGISHLIHHRGQLTVYLRLLDVPLPPLYGPTADEAPSWTQSQG